MRKGAVAFGGAYAMDAARAQSAEHLEALAADDWEPVGPDLDRPHCRGCGAQDLLEFDEITAGWHVGEDPHVSYNEDPRFQCGPIVIPVQEEFDQWLATMKKSSRFWRSS